jgi:hypothetical protein
VHDAGDAGGRPDGFEYAQSIVPGFPRMNHHRFARLTGQFQLAPEDGMLRVARSEIIMIIQADLPQGDHLGMAGQLAERCPGVGAGPARMMGMHAHRRPDRFVALGQPDGSLEIRRPLTCSDGQHAIHSLGQRPVDHRFPVRVEFVAIQMAMRIDEHQVSRAPAGISSWNPASTGLPSPIEAATIIPFDSMPRILRGWRLTTTTTLRPTISSGL